MTSSSLAAAVVAPRDRGVRDRWFVTAALMLMMALAAMEQTVTATAMPTIIGDLHGLEYYAWVPAIYLLAATVTMPLYGRLADALGRKRVIMLAVGLFAVGSILSAFSHSMLELVLFRAIQGLGAGGIMPVVLTILGDIFTIEERARIQGLFSAIWGVASFAGPALGAFLLKTLGWPSIFWVNFPFGIMGLALLAWKYHEHEHPHERELNIPGAALLAAGSAALLVFVTNVGAPGNSWLASGPLALAAAVLLGLYVRHERRSANPVMPLELLLGAAVGPAVLASLIMGMCVFSLDTYVPLYVQGARGGTAGMAAVAVTPVMLGWSLSSFLAAPLVVKWGFRKTATLGSLLVLAGFAGLYLCGLAGAPIWLLVVVLTVAGCGFGPASISCLLGAQDAVDYQQRGSVTSTVTFARTIGGALGVGILGSLLNFVIREDLRVLESHGVRPADLLDPKHAEHAVQVGKTAATLSAGDMAMAQAMLTRGLLWVFAVMATFAVVQALAARKLPRGKHPTRLKPSEAFESGV